MRALQPLGLLLLLLLLAPAASASERRSLIRSVLLPDSPEDAAVSVYVAGGIATVLRFEKPLDPDKTKLLGWEGRFEPLLVGGKKVVLEPLRDITSDDRILLLVTFKDGTELPFIVTAREDRVDHQVNLVPDDDSLSAVRARLSNALGRERAYRADAQRYHEEKNSVDHSLAALLVTGATPQTPFRQRRRQVLDCEGVKVDVSWLAGKGKVAVVFNVLNQHPDNPWRLGETRLSTVTTRDARSFALRMDRDAIAPGASGTIAVVADRSAFESELGVQQLALELFRSDGTEQLQVFLDPRLARE
ncbi:DUF2381 family protein [Myxococcaceae bacterium GXIMD 01537]